ncbi:crotonase/enoyl-CoA hydratase family protein [Sphingomonas sp.]|uniref:crotonase/enoyl-CoA hydratase family protein n=1 Tax=Sphingomonas sp. TaxID=28214 RepID=UPI001D59B15B|nr:crotonase/enoyl-CoA hydratase family protein [Sphingomonas sp.]MBX9797193.1 crotonase/enoyl-CoA hydratase family protein [Sphingomonas sp.]
MAGFETITLAVEAGIATITLNRPERMNAFTPQMMADLIAAFDATDADDAVRAVIVTGAGRAFCAGADLGAGAATFDYAQSLGAAGPVAADGTVDYAHPAVRDGGGQLTLRIFASLKPVIGAINGAAVGVGATMTLPMDFRLASMGARFGFVFARRGIVPEAASSWFLPRLVGIGRALDWCYSGRVFGAEEALAGGLVRSLHAPDDLLPAARALALELTGHSAPVSVALTRRMLWSMLGAAHPMEAHRLDSRAVWLRGGSADAREGVASFLDKRDAVFTDRVSDELPGIEEWFDQPDYR